MKRSSWGPKLGEILVGFNDCINTDLSKIFLYDDATRYADDKHLKSVPNCPTNSNHIVSSLLKTLYKTPYLKALVIVFNTLIYLLLIKEFVHTTQFLLGREGSIFHTVDKSKALFVTNSQYSFMSTLLHFWEFALLLTYLFNENMSIF